MSRLPGEIQQFAADVGVKLYTSEIGFRRGDALKTLKALDNTAVVVYGGDVWRLEQTSWTPTYDNWDYKRQPKESELEFATRSRAKAVDYISNYPDVSDSLLFVMVF
jgi:hypothetical protein